MRKLWSRFLRKVGHGNVIYGSFAVWLVFLVLRYATDLPTDWISVVTLICLLIITAASADAGVK